MTIDEIMRVSPVIPVLIVDDVATAIPIAEALVAGGLRVLEVTLRTPCAIEAIAEMAKVEGAIVGAGTVLNPKGLDAALSAGARFIVSPGLTDRLAHAALSNRVPFLPGISSAGDLMRGLDMDLRHYKFFPAATSGGIPALRALAAPFGNALFCPTGGISQASASDWLAEPHVACIGGSWLVKNGVADVRAIADAASLTRKSTM
ncbi:bifunctional 4-hydroxy-2-oxoglutarate aldolase/2-dehydro-3-deoxy-phosphogluconate aldolase [Sphingobium indicum]|uniref:2-dehydro-3-deoxy-phosphogluconate aldolase n=3 Tax=Sphingobium indicum TaxID=332055 RepID=A0A8E1C2D7_9SPHN|nr:MULTISPECIES: bifunctional 4-hydroxy-2-oxoglutarate aldolase/2-dehydro-3-deoxy-phosphogluconate aldolase [Sphingobium]EPR18819.1 ketohydroxyglutarate aldolase [Sphingobium indicum IP26]KEZ00225.1 2-dehydro-3-deoxyphosphogluconate aldolase [Sphingomonas sp. BHC-A]APL96000.1 2-dehydro-3-deoxyphosphogluconate aldolase [Sphingobium indicum B90A]EQB01013.1 ketohydroxyglutarate aldolase [Sphingobium sp. HDIP04]KER36140.1 2-dehydro-3-deoxyphosphogluconate aldolase [Sphingobium indicum F2]